jgi:hypothetical protein
MRRSLPLLLAVFAVALLAGLPAHAADNPTPAPKPAAPSGCGQPALELAPANACPAPQALLPGALPEPEFMARKGYCHCGCGTATCHTSADCGGASCDPFPSCC